MHNLQSYYDLSSESNNPTTVFSMQDDRGWSIVRIDNACVSDSETCKCHGEANSKDVFLNVLLPEHFVFYRSGGFPTVPLTTGMIRFFTMLSSDHANEVDLTLCKGICKFCIVVDYSS